ncbi:hypothetical protein SDC9_124652 [bioreactor metagenome]|uniref:Uncharacterized protein n=2 Tax=root TaxID=1 RepID=A0A645CL32_9ZZZZ|nr:hypothetical protein [Anaerotignum propionicum]MEA5057708.1 hypothetical protein [Anaerotignum propionicum]
MAISRMQLLRMCSKFFLQIIIFSLIYIWGCFYAYHNFNIAGSILVLISLYGALSYQYKCTFFILEDIYKMNTDVFEGKIEKRVCSDILPYGVMIVNLEKEKEKSGIYHLNIKDKKLIPVGSWVRICYMKKSRIIIDFEVTKMETEDSPRVINWWL